MAANNIGQGMNHLEFYFRKKFSIDESVDILSLMEAAIVVAACKHPQQLAKRRSIIIKTLLHLGDDNSDLEDAININKSKLKSKKTTTTTTTCFPPKIDDQKRQQQQVDKISIPERKSSGETEKKKNINIKEVSSSTTAVTNNKVDEVDKRAMEVKLEASKRKLHESYDRLQADRDKKRIKVLEHDVVPLTTQKSSSSRQKTQSDHVQKRILAVLKAKGRKTS